MADWSQLPKDLLHLISERLDSELYLLRFRSVCSTWRSSIPNHHHHHHRLPSKFPLLSNSNIDSNNNNAAPTFSLSKRTLFLIIPPPTTHPQPHQPTLRPWIMKMGQDSHGQTHLWRPLSRDSPFPPSYFPNVIDFNHLSVLDLGHEFVLSDLPPLSLNHSLYMEKVVVIDTWQDGKDRCSSALLTIHVSGKLAIFRFGEERWTIIPDMLTPYDDVCVFKGKPIAVDCTGRTVTIRSDLSVDLVAEPVFGGDKKFLVESNGELLLVDKHLSCVCYCSFLDDDNGGGGGDGDDGEFYGVGLERAVSFDVFRLDEEEKMWVEMNSLRDRILFLGDDCAFSLSALDLCFVNGNCVIFRDDAFDGILILSSNMMVMLERDTDMHHTFLFFPLSHTFTPHPFCFFLSPTGEHPVSCEQERIAIPFDAQEFGLGVFDLDQRQISSVQKDYGCYFDLFWPPKWIGVR